MKRILVGIIIECIGEIDLRVIVGRLKLEVSYRHGWWYIGGGVWHWLLIEMDGFKLERGSIWAGLGRSIYRLHRFGAQYISVSVW